MKRGYADFILLIILFLILEFVLRTQVKERSSNDISVVYGSDAKQHGDLQHSTLCSSRRRSASSKAVNQRDADLLHFWHKYQKAPEGSHRKTESRKQLSEALAHRMHIDASIKLIGNVLFGLEKGPEVLNAVRPSRKRLVDDWDCLKTFVRTFETHCGSLSQSGMKHTRSIANFCNAGITKEQMKEASSLACPNFPSNSWSSIKKGFSA